VLLHKSPHKGMMRVMKLKPTVRSQGKVIPRRDSNFVNHLHCIVYPTLPVAPLNDGNLYFCIPYYNVKCNAKCSCPRNFVQYGSN